MILGAVIHGILAFFFAVIAILLMVVILLQRGRGVGLAGAFGGTGGHSAFGAKTGDFLTWVTVIGAGVVLLFAVLLNFVFVPPQADLGPSETPAGPAAPGPGAPAPPPLPPPPGAWLTAPAPQFAHLVVFGEKIG